MRYRADLKQKLKKNHQIFFLISVPCCTVSGTVADFSATWWDKDNFPPCWTKKQAKLWHHISLCNRRHGPITPDIYIMKGNNTTSARNTHNDEARGACTSDEKQSEENKARKNQDAGQCVVCYWWCNLISEACVVSLPPVSLIFLLLYTAVFANEQTCHKNNLKRAGFAFTLFSCSALEHLDGPFQQLLALFAAS